MILKNIEEVIQGKALVSADATDLVSQACEKMAETKERALAILENGKLVGVLSETDVVHKGVAKGLTLNEVAVSEIMTPSPSVIQAHDSVAHAIDIMAEGKFHHLPVLKDAALIGMIYSDDIPEEYKLLLEHYKELKGQ